MLKCVASNFLDRIDANNELNYGRRKKQRKDTVGQVKYQLITKADKVCPCTRKRFPSKATNVI